MKLRWWPMWDTCHVTFGFGILNGGDLYSLGKNNWF